MWSKLICSALLGVFLASNFEVNDAVVFRFTNFVCKSYNESAYVFHNCRLKAVSRDRVLLNMNGSILHAVKNITLHAQIFKKANGFKPWVVDATVDACHFMRTKSNPYIKIVYSMFKQFTNINHTCPLVGLQDVKDFYLQKELLKLPFPTGEYLLSMQWFFYNKPTMDSNVTFAYVEDFIKKRN